MALAKTRSGLLFRDAFDRADASTLGPAWFTTAFEGGNNWGVRGGKAVQSPISGGARSAWVNGVSVVDVVVQGRIMRPSVGDANLWLWARRDPVSGKGMALYVSIPSAASTNRQLVLYTYSPAGSAAAFKNNAWSDGVEHAYKYHAQTKNHRVWMDGQLQFTHTGALAADGVAGQPGIRSSSTATKTGTFDDFAVCTGNAVTVLGLPSGYTASVGTGTATAGEDGRAAPDAGGALWPLPLTVRDRRGRTVDAFPETWGGDELVYTTPTAGWAYERLPPAMRERDQAAGAPLERLVRTLSAGVQPLRDAAGDVLELVDVDACPPGYLPLLGSLLGFEFPYDLPVEQQRNFVRSAVSLYRHKGTPLALTFMVTRIIGSGFRPRIANEDYLAKTFTVLISADEDAALRREMEQKIEYLIDLYSPAGMVPTAVFQYRTEEASAAAPGDAFSTAAQHTNWRFNVRGHRMNLNAKPNGFGVVALDL